MAKVKVLKTVKKVVKPSEKVVKKVVKKAVEIIACGNCGVKSGKFFKPGLVDSNTVCPVCNGSGQVEA